MDLKAGETARDYVERKVQQIQKDKEAHYQLNTDSDKFFKQYILGLMSQRLTVVQHEKSTNEWSIKNSDQTLNSNGQDLEKVLKEFLEIT